MYILQYYTPDAHIYIYTRTSVTLFFTLLINGVSVIQIQLFQKENIVKFNNAHHNNLALYCGQY